MTRKPRKPPVEPDELDGFIAMLHRRATVSFVLNEDAAKQYARLAALLEELKELRAKAYKPLQGPAERRS